MDEHSTEGLPPTDLGTQTRMELDEAKEILTGVRDHAFLDPDDVRNLGQFAIYDLDQIQEAIEAAALNYMRQVDSSFDNLSATRSGTRIVDGNKNRINVSITYEQLPHQAIGNPKNVFFSYAPLEDVPFVTVHFPLRGDLKQGDMSASVREDKEYRHVEASGIAENSDVKKTEFIWQMIRYMSANLLDPEGPSQSYKKFAVTLKDADEEFVTPIVQKKTGSETLSQFNFPSDLQVPKRPEE